MDYPNFYYNETITSFVIRQTLSEGYPSPRMAQQLLWSNGNLQINSSFPSLIPRVSELYGISRNKLVGDHTCLNYFRPFLSKSKYQKIKKTLANGNTGFVHKWLGLTANRMKEYESLQYCPICASEDVKNIGVAYWHREHQLYGTTQCNIHGIELFERTIKRRNLLLPPQIECFGECESSLSPSIFTNISYWFLCQKSIEYFNPKQLTDCYRIALFERGLACQSLGIRQEEFRHELKCHYENELKTKEWQQIFESNHTYPYPQQLFYNYNKCHLHPAKHIALIAFLFNSPDEFLSAYQCSKENTAIHFQSHQISTEDKRNSVKKITAQIMRLFKKGLSLRKISKHVGLSVISIKSKVLANGGVIKRRESKIFADERRSIFRKLFIGIPTKKIAKQFDISIGAVEQLLTQYPAIVKQRSHFRYREKQVKHRSILTAAMARNPNYSRNSLKLKVSASYLWLFKNDKQWLYKNLPPSKLNIKLEK
jgi:transposase-like protein